MRALGAACAIALLGVIGGLHAQTACSPGATQSIKMHSFPWGPAAPGTLYQVFAGTPEIGPVNGTNVSFTLPSTPSSLVTLFFNGVRQRPGVDYVVRGRTVTLTSWPVAPFAPDVLDVEYWIFQ